MKKISNNAYIIDLLNNMGISRTFNMSGTYLFYDDQPLYPELGDDSRSSLSQVKGTDMECVTTIFVNQIDKTKPEEKSTKKPESI
jgi:hypothetical protein